MGTAFTAGRTGTPGLSAPLREQRSHWQHLARSSRARGLKERWPNHPRAGMPSVGGSLAPYWRFLCFTLKLRDGNSDQLNERSQSISQQSHTKTRHHNAMSARFFTASWYFRCSRWTVLCTFVFMWSASKYVSQLTYRIRETIGAVCTNGSTTLSSASSVFYHCCFPIALIANLIMSYRSLFTIPDCTNVGIYINELHTLVSGKWRNYVFPKGKRIPLSNQAEP